MALRGHHQDGHQYLSEAINQGAIALVVEDKTKVDQAFQGAVVEVLDSRLSLQALSRNFYGAPGDQLLSLAVTGTNGKTTTTLILEYLLNGQDRFCGVIGTIDHHIGKKVWPTDLTTPDPVTLQARLQAFLNLGGKSFVMEASSHALVQNRLTEGFEGVLFTNLSRDHLDYHKTMEDYFLAKAQLFKAPLLKKDRDCVALVNGDDPYGKRLLPLIEGRRIYTYGQGDHCDLRFEVLKNHLEGTEIRLKVAKRPWWSFESPLIGEHNVYNLVGALGLLYGLGLDLKKAINAFQSFPGIPGRMEKMKNSQGVFAFVDYAHTPDALEKALGSLKPLMGKGQKLITVFGCGGDRDPGKRPLMGELSHRLSDLTIVTSDNPRQEDPAQIIKDISQGVVQKGTETSFLSIIDRRGAIIKACELAQPGDVILVAGKGHEKYQILGSQKLPFDDCQVLQEALTHISHKV